MRGATRAQWHCSPMTEAPRSLLRTWGRLVARHPKVIVVFWVVFIVAGVGFATGTFGNTPLFEKLHSGEIVVPGENWDGRQVLKNAGMSGYDTYFLTVEGVDLTSPDVAASSVRTVQEITAIPHIQSAANPFVVQGGPTSPAAAKLLGGDGIPSKAFATVVQFDTGLSSAQEKAARAQVDRAFDTLVADLHPARSDRGGVRPLVDEIVGQVQADGKTGEGIALPISFVVMVVVFGGFLAAGFPIAGAIASIAGALASLQVLSHWMDLEATVVNVVTVLGLGLCIDYGLLVVSRFREEMRERERPADSTIDRRGERRGFAAADLEYAVGQTLHRAGRTVIFSAITVAMSLGGMFVLDVDLVRAVAAAGISVVVVALAVALTLIPALCVLGARRILRRGVETSSDRGVFSALALFVQRFPWPVIVATTTLLVVAALPSLSLQLTSSGPELLPKGNAQREFFDNTRVAFPRLGGAEVFVVARTTMAEATAYMTTAADIPGVQSVDPPTAGRDSLVLIGLRTGDGGLGTASRDVVQHLRDHRPPFQSWTVGQASSVWDFQKVITERAPWAIALVVLATFLLLFLMTGSLVVPLKAVAMNVVSLGASLGIIVWVFQEGHLQGLLGFTPAQGLEATVPVLVLAFGFGLSMDYEVFLLARIVELHEQGVPTDRAVSLGLQRSGRIITSAALLMVIVFAGFAAGKILMMKEMGIGLVAAVVVDATLVRMLLVPATMTVLGQANWWAPAPLKRLHARWGITE